MSDISFPRGQQSIADLSAPSQNPTPQAAPERPDPADSSLLDIQAVFVSPRRVVDDGGVQLLFRDSESGEVLRSFPPETASSVYQNQQDINEQLASSTPTPAETAPAAPTAEPVASVEAAPIAAAPAEPTVSAEPVAAPAPATPAPEAGNLTAAALTPNNDQVGADAPPADDTEISLTGA